MIQWRAIVVATLSLVGMIGAEVAVAGPKVVATVAPVHSLAAAIMRGVGEPRLLIRGGVSPHEFVLRPSDRRALAGARVVFWVGEGMESFLPRVLNQLDGGTRIVELAQLPGVERLPPRAGGIWAPHEHEPPSHGDHAHEGDYDPHLWLDPHNAARWAQAMVETLNAVDPAHAAIYRENGRQLQTKLSALDTAMEQALAPVRTVPFVVFHDAYQYLEHRYGLTAAGSVSVGDGRAPGARRLGELRDLLQARGARCIFAEPQFEPRLIRTLVEGTEVKQGVLDPLGAGLTPGPELYFDLMHGLASNLTGCLR